MISLAHALARQASWRLLPRFSDASLSAKLLEACAATRHGAAMDLLSRGADPVVAGPSGSSPLMFAARHDQPDLFLALCAHPKGRELAAMRDRQGRDALYWASSRAPFARARGERLSDLFSRIDESLFDLWALDRDGRHACQTALVSADEQACLFWLARAPGGIVSAAIEKFDVWQRHLGIQNRALRWRALSESAAIDPLLPPAEGLPSRPPRPTRL